MIEVEKKFILSEKDIARLVEGAEFLSDHVFTDTYYDTEDLALGKNDMWLRSRNGRFDLKIPKHADGGEMSQQYQEIEGEEKIRQIFDLVQRGDFLQDISKYGYVELCNLKTTRKKYRKENFIIDLDIVEAEGFNYTIGEIELMVENETEMPSAIKAIEEFAEGRGLESKPVNGKVREYLKRKKPEKYQALVDVGVMKA
ncbi:MAG: thiamine triphosphatase [uncultured bacterium]|nr:MAG: thiamine triphosphatase [uncultured bacterium]